MSVFELLPFQEQAAHQIADRYMLLRDDIDRPTYTARRAVPYFQALQAITGAGKTAILAEAVAQIAATMPLKPIVLWTTRLRIVVEQTRSNFEAGGKYSSLLPGFNVMPLRMLDRDAVRDGSTPLVAVTTVGGFNDKDKDEEGLAVHKVALDQGEESLWTTLTKRETSSGGRPLIVVYDEGHNLTDPQAELLMGLAPDVLLVASATLSWPAKINEVIGRLASSGWSTAATDASDTLLTSPAQTSKGLVTAVSSATVVGEGLVKKTVDLSGQEAAMEPMLAEMLAAMAETTKAADDLNAGFKPKAIYVCQSNINPEDDTKDDPRKPFKERKAPPIQIWRYLVEKGGVAPSEVVIYCDLEMDRDFPAPEGFHLLRGADKDFQKFSEGSFRHIIFNQRLQEGWDDPECAFAYIDKTMRSPVQVRQIIGRVLRQPGATHYADPLLNTASFFIRIEDRQEFPAILQTVKADLGSTLPGVKVRGLASKDARSRSRLLPKRERLVPQVHVDGEEAIQPLRYAVAAITDFSKAPALARGPAGAVRAKVEVGEAGDVDTILEERPHSALVRARWLVRREVKQVHPMAAEAVEWDNPRFEAPVEIRSEAANILRFAGLGLAETFLEHAQLAFEENNLYHVGPIQIDPDTALPYVNALHERYDLKPFEVDVAREIDLLGFDWARNPENGGYSIPLPTKGKTKRFFPDFLVWKPSKDEDLIYALDPKGPHLLARDVVRKLMDIRDEKGNRRILVRFISQGKFNDTLEEVGGVGFTVFSIVKSTGNVRAQHHKTLTAAVQAALA